MNFKPKALLSLLSIALLASCGTINPSTSGNVSDSGDNPSIDNPSISGDSTSEDPSISPSTPDPENKKIKIEVTGLDNALYAFRIGVDTNVVNKNKSIKSVATRNVVSDYYSGLTSWSSSSDLKTQLNTLINSNYTALSYDWLVNKSADQDLTNHDMVYQVYKDDPTLKANPKTGNSGDMWQREHAFPASLMTGQLTADAVKVKGVATDYHNLLASFTSGNSSRGNKQYGVVSEPTNIDYGGNYKSNETIFEPADVDKGRVARAILYMAVKWDGLSVVEDTSTCSITAAQSGTKCHGNLSTLIQWSNEHAPDRVEYQHNQYVYTQQGNRNPFVDYPQLVDYVYGSKISGTLSSFTPTSTTLDVFNSTDVANYAIHDCKYFYKTGDVFSKANDIKCYPVYKDYHVGSDVTSFTLTGVSDEEEFDNAEVKTITVSYNSDIVTTYPLTIELDPVSKATWHHSFSGAGAGGEFNSIKDNNGVDNKLTLDGIDWNIYWQNGSVSSFSKNKGTKFGAAGTGACTKVYFETYGNYPFATDEVLNALYFEGNVASGKTATVSFYYAGELLSSQTLSYTAGATHSTIAYYCE